MEHTEHNFLRSYKVRNAQKNTTNWRDRKARAGEIARNLRKYRISGRSDCDECRRGNTTSEGPAP